MNKELFRVELNLIQNDQLRETVERILLTCDGKHNTEPASSTGKYHPPFAHDKGGLIRHTKAVVLLTETLCNTDLSVNKDNMIAAAILHDMHKYDDCNQHTLFPHPVLMANQCIEAGIPEVGEILASHMGQWTTSKYSTIVLPHPSTKEQWMLHYADYIASRTWFDLAFNEDWDIVQK